MYDTASVSLKKGTRSGIFLDKNLELDESIEIPEQAFFVIKTGTTDSSLTTGVISLSYIQEGFIVHRIVKNVVLSLRY